MLESSRTVPRLLLCWIFQVVATSSSYKVLALISWIRHIPLGPSSQYGGSSRLEFSLSAFVLGSGELIEWEIGTRYFVFHQPFVTMVDVIISFEQNLQFRWSQITWAVT